jgi:hypothetical protein
VTAVDSIVTLVIGDDGILVMERLRRVIELKKKKKKERHGKASMGQLLTDRKLTMGIRNDEMIGWS